MCIDILLITCIASIVSGTSVMDEYHSWHIVKRAVNIASNNTSSLAVIYESMPGLEVLLCFSPMLWKPSPCRMK